MRENCEVAFLSHRFEDLGVMRFISTWLESAWSTSYKII